MKVALRLITISTVIVLSGTLPLLALNPSLDVSQYGHTAWTIRDGFFKGSIYSIAQTADGYLWLGTEFGLLRFDGVRTIPLPPPADERLLAGGINKLVGGRDGSLWIGTFVGVVSMSNGETMADGSQNVGTLQA